MRALIVDDEAPARAKLRHMLGAFSDVDVVGEAADGASALSLAAELRPDVIFLDVQMPEVDGFDVAASLPDDAPALVFVTAYDRYALKAFDAQAADYLLKPVDPERLERTVQRLRKSALAAIRPSVGMPANLAIARKTSRLLASRKTTDVGIFTFGGRSSPGGGRSRVRSINVWSSVFPSRATATRARS